MIDANIWKGRRVLVTGHMGFKGSWLTALLDRFGARTVGFGRDARPDPLLYRQLRFDRHESVVADVNETDRLAKALNDDAIECVFHLAAQPIVLTSYTDPLGTFRDNVMGTASVLEAVRRSPAVKAAIVVTSDKVYENQEWSWPYRETDRLGGHDPYSASKAAAEIVTQAMISSYFSAAGCAQVATARAGNVIGGGDWADHRLVPDAVRGFSKGEGLVLRNPRSVRPWQHVLDPLSGYVELAQAMLGSETPLRHASWNFGPAADDAWPVSRIADAMTAVWGDGAAWKIVEQTTPAAHEAGLLTVDSARARAELGWEPTWRVRDAVERTMQWYRRHHEGDDANALVAADIEAFLAARAATAS